MNRKTITLKDNAATVYREGENTHHENVTDFADEKHHLVSVQSSKFGAVEKKNLHDLLDA